LGWKNFQNGEKKREAGRGKRRKKGDRLQGNPAQDTTIRKTLWMGGRKEGKEKNKGDEKKTLYLRDSSNECEYKRPQGWTRGIKAIGWGNS